MKKTKFNWGHGILIFLVIFVSLSVVFIIFSLNQNQDLVSDDYYDQGADFSKQIKINQNSTYYNDSIQIIKQGTGIQLKLCKTLASSGDSLFLYFYRPSDKRSDRKLKMLMSEESNLPTLGMESGRYLVKMSWSHKGEWFNINKDLTIE